MTKNDSRRRTMRIDLIPDSPVELAKGAQVPPARGGRPPKAKATVSYAELYQRSYDAVIVADRSGNIVDANPRAADFLGHDEAELLALGLPNVISSMDQSLLERLCENLKQAQYALIQAYCLRKDGSFFPAEIAVSPTDADVKQLSFAVRDITVRKQAEEMLKIEHNAIKNLGAGLLIADLEGKVEYLNPVGLQIWGCEKAEDLLGKDIRDLLVDKEAADAMIRNVLDEKTIWAADLQASTAQGKQVDVQIIASCNCNVNGEVVGVILSVADVTDQKLATKAEREAERRRVMLESLGAACYHLGRPATVVLANMGALAARITDPDDATRELISSGIEAAESIGEILHKLNTVNEYKTTQFLERPEGSEDSDENRIVDI
ncbi:PAS domain-containing protein [Verrucomicrobiota bacterium]